MEKGKGKRENNGSDAVSMLALARVVDYGIVHGNRSLDPICFEEAANRQASGGIVRFGFVVWFILCVGWPW